MERIAELPATQQRATHPSTDGLVPGHGNQQSGGDPARPSRGSQDDVVVDASGRSPSGFGYLPSLDGLRAVAVAAVVIYHSGLGWLPGGFLGVEVFFVISGYLITCLLLAERHRTGTIGLRTFWVRRARRLLPALYLVLLVSTLWWLLFHRGEVHQLRGDVLAALTYVTNWWLVFSKQSYFVQAGRPSPFRHLWSLAVEEQFYLAWPLVFTLLMVVTAGVRRKAVAVLLAGAALSALLMYVLFDAGADPSRPYYGTDTRASGLLFGAALAFFLPPWRLSRRTGKAAPFVIDTLGFMTLGGLAWFFLRVNEFDPFVYQRGFLLLDLLTVAIIVAIIHPAAVTCRRLLSCSPLVWVGQRSYGIYLWHWPVFVLTRPHQDIGLTGIPLLVLRLLITVGLAEASFRFVEQPIRHGAIGHLAARLRSVGVGDSSPSKGRAILAISATLLLVGAVAVGLLTTPARNSPLPPGFEHVLTAGTIPPPTVAGQTVPQSPSTGGARGPATSSPVPSTSMPGIPPATTARPTTTPRPTTSMATTPPIVTPTTVPTTGPGAPLPALDVTAIGDSVMLGAHSALTARLPGLYVNAAVGRQWREVPGIAAALDKAGYLRPVVVVNLGTNGAVTSDFLDKLFDELTSKRVLLVNTRVDRPWEALVNRRLAEAARKHPNAVLVDWLAASDGHPEYFVADGVHLTTVGARAYAEAIARSVH